MHLNIVIISRCKSDDHFSNMMDNKADLHIQK